MAGGAAVTRGSRDIRSPSAEEQRRSPVLRPQGGVRAQGAQKPGRGKREAEELLLLTEPRARPTAHSRDGCGSELLRRILHVGKTVE